MPPRRTLIHDGSNDDRWYLCRGDDPADVYVFHEPNVPSGGRSSRIELAAFLASANGSPEHRALLVMIGSLVGADRADLASSVATPEPGAVTPLFYVLIASVFRGRPRVTSSRAADKTMSLPSDIDMTRGVR